MVGNVSEASPKKPLATDDRVSSFPALISAMSAPSGPGHGIPPGKEASRDISRTDRTEQHIYFVDGHDLTGSQMEKQDKFVKKCGLPAQAIKGVRAGWDGESAPGAVIGESGGHRLPVDGRS